MPGPLRVLIVEESDEQVEVLERELRTGGYEPTVRVVNIPTGMATALEKEKWQLVLSNYTLPAFGAAQALDMVQKKGLDIPFIVVCRNIGEEAAVSIIKAGANDLILEQNLKQLPVVVDRELREAAARRSRKWMEEALKKNEARERAILESCPDSILSISHDGKLTEFNPAAEKTFGFPRAAVLGKEAADVILPPSVREQFRRGLATSVNKGDWNMIGRRVEMSAQRADGTSFPIEITMNVIRTDGPPIFTAIIRDITERLKAEESLRESEERVRTLLEGIDDALFVHNEEGRILDCNEAACRRLGYSKEELLSMRTGDIESPEFAETFYERLAQQAAVGRCSFEGTHITKSARRIFVDINTSVINYKGQGAVLAVMRDITARKQAEQSLAESQAFYISLVESLPQNIVRKDLQGRVTFANQKACFSIGRTFEDLVGKTDADLFPYELAEKYRQDDLRVMQTGESLDAVEDHQLPSGARIYVHVVKTPVRDSDNNVIGTQVIWWDETERVRASEEIRRTQIFLNAVVESLPVMVFAKEAKEFRNIIWNKAAEEIFGITREEVRGKNDYDFQPKEKAEFFIEKDREVLKDKKMLDIPEEVIQSRTRGERILHTKKVPILDDKGNPLYLLGIAEDITDRKKAEDKLRKAEEFLDSIVENLPVGVFIKDAKDLRFVHWNKTNADLLGIPRGEMIGKSDHDFFPKEEADFFVAKDREVLAGKKLVDIPEEEVKTRHKGIRVFHTRKIPILDAAGEPVFLLGIMEDITDQKKKSGK